MNRRDFDIDHIDPRWEDGRDYQLVCGLDCPLNYREEEPRKNTSKSNRFLPWRWSRDEIGVVPKDPGDLAFFLVGADIENNVPGEWVLMEFLSEEWFEATRDTHGSAVHNNYRHIREFHEKHPEAKYETLTKGRDQHLAWRRQNPEYEQNHAQMMREKRMEQERNNPELLRRRMEKVHAHLKERWQCLVTGHISTPSALTKYQRNRNIDPSNRIRLQ